MAVDAAFLGLAALVLVLVLKFCFPHRWQDFTSTTRHDVYHRRVCCSGRSNRDQNDPSARMWSDGVVSVFSRTRLHYNFNYHINSVTAARSISRLSIIHCIRISFRGTI